MSTAIGDLVARLGMDARGFRKGAAGATTSLRGMGVTAGVTAAIVNKSMDAIVAGFRRVTRAARDFGAAGLDFNASMRSSLAIMSGVTEEAESRMNAAAFSAARDTGQSASDMARSYFYLASAGMDAEQSIAALPQVARFAAAGVFDMATATDLATDAQSALGLSSKNAVQNLAGLSRVTDVLIGANTLANASAQQFSEALTNKAGPAIRSLGKDVTEGVAVLAAFADQGIKGAEAGTQLGIVLRDLQTKAIQNKKAFAAAGVSVFDSAGEMRHMADIVGDVERLFVGMSDMAKKASLLDLGFSDKSVSALMALIGTSDKIRTYNTRLNEMGGITERVAKKQLGPFEKGLNSIKVSVVEAGASIMQWWSPKIGELFGNAAKSLTLVQRILENSKSFRQFADNAERSFRAVVANIDIMLGSWKGFTDTVKNSGTIALLEAEKGWETAAQNFKTVWGDTKTWWKLLWHDMETAAAKAMARLLPEKDPKGNEAGKAGQAVGAGKYIEPRAVISTRASRKALRDAEDEKFIKGDGVTLNDMKTALRMELEGKLPKPNFFPSPEESAHITRVATQGSTKAMQYVSPADKSAAEAAAKADTKRAAIIASNDSAAKAAADHFAKSVSDIDRKLKAVGDLWEKQKKELPTLSDRFKKAWAKFGDGPTTPTTTGGAVGGKPISGGASGIGIPDQPTPTRGPKFAAAMEKGTAAAYSTIVNAGKQNDKIAKEQLKIAKDQLAQQKRIVDKLDFQTVSIPA